MVIKEPIILNNLQPGFRKSEIRLLQSQIDRTERIMSGEIDGGIN